MNRSAFGETAHKKPRQTPRKKDDKEIFLFSGFACKSPQID
jgi:hypothetical protein